METKETLKKLPDEKLAELFEQAHHDLELKHQLLRDPRAVGDKFGVKFSDDEVKQLQQLGGLTELAEEIKVGRLYPRPPIFYPIHVWQIKELLDIFTHLIPGPIFYPAPDYSHMPVYTTRAAYNPGWVTYPGDDPGGGGSSGGIHTGGGVIPGPIFYPAGLRNFIKERLVQILQVKQLFR